MTIGPGYHCLGLFGVSSLVAACALGRPADPSPPLQLERTKEELGRARWLASFGSDELGGRLSPDGRRLVYASDQKGSFDIWIKDLQSGALERLTRHPAQDLQPCWEPDGRGVVFVSMRRDAKGELFRWRDGKLESLGGRRMLEADPRVARDGTIYFSGGKVGSPRIHSRRGDQVQPVTEKGASHPAISADGKLLAYTWLDPQGRARVVVKRLSDGRRFVVTTADYAAGRPTFSPDGQQLAFVRYYRGPPRRPRTSAAKSSIWSLKLAPVFEGASPQLLMQQAIQLTADRHQVMSLQWHHLGMVFSGSHAASLDVGIYPASGVLPLGRTARQLAALAGRQDNLWDRLLCLRRARQLAPLPLRGEVLSQEATILIKLGQFAKAERILETLVATKSQPHAQLARLDLARLPAERERWRASKGLANDWRRAGAQTLVQLNALTLRNAPPLVLARRTLIRAEWLARLGKTAAALAAHEEVLTRYGSQRELRAEASLRMGRLFARMRDPARVSRYYLQIVREFPKQKTVVWGAARALVRLFKGSSPKERIEGLRVLLDQVPRQGVPFALASQALARQYEAMGQLQLAVESMMHAATNKGNDGKLLLPEAAFELGRLALARADQLRKARRAHGALAQYGLALTAYELIMRNSERGGERYHRAHREYLRLGLAEAAQLAIGGAKGAAEKRYRRLLRYDDEAVAAHRGLIMLEVARGRLEAVRTRYARRIARSRADYVARYALGLLETLDGPLSKQSLDRATKHLKQAVALRPRDPFAHMTLGWVAEMRERFLLDRGKGWLEAAIERYQRARTLNDARVDPRTEVDLLINLANVFVSLGGEWVRVKRLCERRRRIGLLPRSPEQRAYHHYACGRAEAATGDHRRAASNFERALEIARERKLSVLGAELTARVGLTEQQRGNFSTAIRRFQEAGRLFAAQGDKAGELRMARTVSYNLLLQRRDLAAIAQLKRARGLLGEPAKRRGDYIPISPAGAVHASTNPFGLTGPDGVAALFALEEIAEENRGDPRRAMTLLRRRVALLDVKIVPHSERARELVVLYSRLAAAARQLGDSALYSRAMKRARELLARRDGDTVDDEEGLALELAVELNHAHELLAREAPKPSSLNRSLRRLLGLEARRKRAQNEAAAAIASRLRFSLWATLGALRWRLYAPPQTLPKKGGGPARSWARSLEPLVRAEHWFRAIYRESTAEGILPEPPPKEGQLGMVAPLWRPLVGNERSRWQVRAALNLAALRATFCDRDQLKNHASTKFLADLATRLEVVPLGALRHVLDVELAYRRRSLERMRAGINAFVAQAPLRTSAASAERARALRRRIFSRAVALATELGAGADALAFVEQRQRRAFVDDLLRLPLRVPGKKGSALLRLLRAASAHGVHIGTRPADPKDPRFATWDKTRQNLAHAVSAAEKLLGNDLPGVARLLEVGRFPLPRLRAALGKGAVALKLFASGRSLFAAIVRPVGDVTLHPLGRLHGRGTMLATSRQALRQLVHGASVVWVDLGPMAALAPLQVFGRGVRVRELLSLWSRLDTMAFGEVSLPGGLVLGDGHLSLPEGFGKLGQPTQWSTIERALDDKGILVLAGALSWGGRSAADLALWGGASALSLTARLGERLGPEVVVVAEGGWHAEGQQRRRQALLRLLNALGVATVVFAEGRLKLLRRYLEALAKGDRAQAALAVGWRSYGNPGTPPDRRRAAAEGARKRAVFAGAKAFKSRPRRLALATRLLEKALRLERFLGDKKFLGGALLFAANAHTLRGDVWRALPRARRLLALRKEAMSRSSPKHRLRATAKYVKALEKMVWLQLRAKLFADGLKTNQLAIDIYESVKRPLMARLAHEQRSLLYERMGRHGEALAEARRAQAAARALARKGVRSKLNQLAEAGIRVARLERRRLSRYQGALVTLKQVTLELAAPTIEALEASQRAMQQTALTAKQRPKDKAARRAGRQARAAYGDNLRAIRLLVTLMLEQSRAHGARGVYGAALESAKEALALSKAVGDAPSEPLLEVANNHYYLGDFPAALQMAMEGAKASAGEPLRQLQFLNAQGTSLARMGRLEGALRTLRRALAIAGRLRRPQEIAATYNNIADALRSAGRFSEASAAFSQALRLDREHGDLLGQSFSLTNLGLTSALMGFANRAERQLRAGLVISQKIKASLNQLKGHAGLSRLALARRQWGVAEREATQGSAIAKRTGQRRWLWRFALLAARGARGAGAKKRALSLALAGARLLWRSAPGRQPPLSAPRLDERPEELFDLVVELLAESGATRRAFRWGERRRMRAVANRMSRGILRLAREKGQQEVAKLLRLVSEREAGSEATGAEPAKGRLRTTELARPLAQLMDPRVGSIEEIQRALRLRPATTLLVLYPTAHRLLAWSLDGRSLRMHSSRLNRSRLQGAISDLQMRLRYFQDPKKVARQLYDWLIAPSEAALKGKRRLVVVGAGELRGLPYAALFDGRRYLMQRMATSQLETAQAMVATSKQLAGRRPSRQVPWASFAGGFKVGAPLPHAARESRAWGRSFSRVEVFEGARATRASLLAKLATTARVHLATHGTMNPDDPLAGRLQLHDGPLRLEELLQQGVKSDLVVVSACNSGHGSPAAGVTADDLAWVLRVAGADYVVSALWRISDLGAALTMKRFARELASSGDPVEALAEAQRALAKRHPHPAFWGLFRIHGL